VHFLPTVVLDEVDQLPTRIIYIYRDLRDVVVSAFFYRNRVDEADMRIARFRSLLSRGPRRLVRYCRNRTRLLRSIQKLCIDGYAKDIGTWSQHITAWQDITTQQTDLYSTFVSYEELLDDTSSTILRIIHELRLPEPSDKTLQTAVERQSFAALREHFHKMPNEAYVPLGKDFNIRFLRKGVSADWKRFLSSRMGHIIHNYHGEKLIELGYEPDSEWYEKIAHDMLVELFAVGWNIIAVLKSLLKRVPGVRPAWRHSLPLRVIIRHRLRGSPVPPPHIVKLRWLRRFQKSYSLKTLVESGTYQGTTVAAMLDRFEQIYTIELDDLLCERARDRFTQYPHVHVVQGNSGDVLPSVLEAICVPCLFWLDGHYSGAGTARGSQASPIIEELAAIRSHPCKDHVILIDDAREFCGRNGYPTLGVVRSMLKEINANYTVRIVDDMIQAYPRKRWPLRRRPG